jgi:hypothetical protein
VTAAAVTLTWDQWRTAVDRPAAVALSTWPPVKAPPLNPPTFYVDLCDGRFGQFELSDWRNWPTEFRLEVKRLLEAASPGTTFDLPGGLPQVIPLYWGDDGRMTETEPPGAQERFARLMEDVRRHLS